MITAIRVTNAIELGVTWSRRIHYVAAGSTVDRYPTGDFATAMCSGGISVLVDAGEHEALSNRWREVSQILRNAREGRKVREPVCKNCARLVKKLLPPEGAK